MNKLVTPFRVGLLVVVATGLLVGVLIFVQKGGLSGGDSVTYVAYFRDASGISPKSRVQIAGIPVGEVQRVTLEGSRAKIFLRIKRDVGVKTDAVLTKRSESILGDYLLDLAPGSEGAPPLADGQEIARVVDAQGMQQMFESLNRITGDISQVTQALRDSLGGQQGAASLQTIVNNMVRLSGAVDETVARSSAQLESILRNVESVSSDVRGLSSSQENNVRTILENITVITGDVREVAQSVREAVASPDGGLANTGATISGTIGKLDRTLANLETVTAQIKDGKGVAGQLLSNEQLGHKLGEAVEGVSDLATRITNLQAEVTVRSEYLFAQGAVKNFIGLRLTPKPDKYYLIELVDDPRGTTTETIIQNNPPAAGQPVTQLQRVTTNSLKISAQFAKRYYFATFRFGIIESTGGVGADLQFFDDKLSLKFDAFDFAVREQKFPRLRAAVRYSPINHIFATVGIDDIINNQVRDSTTHQLLSGRDLFVGAGVYFTDDDLKAILPFTPVGAIR